MFGVGLLVVLIGMLFVCVEYVCLCVFGMICVFVVFDVWMDEVYWVDFVWDDGIGDWCML